MKSIGAFEPVSLQGHLEYFGSQLQYCMLILLDNPQREALFILSLNYGGMLHCGAQVLHMYTFNHRLESLQFLECIFYSCLEN